MLHLFSPDVSKNTHAFKVLLYSITLSICECGALDQTAAHVIMECLLHRGHQGYFGLLVLDDETG